MSGRITPPTAAAGIDQATLDTAVAAKISKSTLDANTILYATTDDTPAALAVAASRIVGRKATGDIGALTAAEIVAILNATLAASYAAANAPGTLLASKSHANATNYTTTSATSADVDATNLAVTFTVPPSGEVLVRFTALCNASTNADYGRFSVREGSSDIAGPFNVSANPNTQIISAVFKITGLTPGASKTYKWGFSRVSTITFGIFTVAASGFPPAVMEVIAA